MRNHSDMPSQLGIDPPDVPWGGVLPSPEVLKRYEEIVPGAASRILEAAEQEHRHRQHREREALGRETFALETAQVGHVKDARWRFIGFLVVYAFSILGIASSIYIILIGHQLPGMALCMAFTGMMIGAVVGSSNGRGFNRLRRSRTPESNERTG